VKATSDAPTRYSGFGWQNPEPITRAHLAPIYGIHAAHCTSVFNSWSHGSIFINDDDLDSCIDFMGITEYCDKMDHALVGTGSLPDGAKVFQCEARTESEDVLEQIVHIGKGVAEGLVTAAPFVALGVQGAACAEGVVFACATIAVQVAGHAVPNEVRNVYGYVNDALQCSNGDVVACSTLGVAALKAADISIPGEDLAQLAFLADRCRNNDFRACMILGQKAAGAAGVPVGAINLAAINAEKCFNGDPQACIALGEQAADARVPFNSLPNARELISRCSPGDVNNIDAAKRVYEDCQKIGQALAAISR